MSLEDVQTVDTVKPEAGIAVPGESAPEAEKPETGGDDTETRARAMGWVDKEEFRGPAEKWRPADEFVKKGEEDLPVLRENLRRTTGKLTELERRLAAKDDEVKRIERMSTVALQKQRDQLTSNYEAAMRQAVESGDVARYDQLRRDQYQAVTDFDQRTHEAVNPNPPPAQAKGLPPELAKVRDTWVEKNTWFMYDQDLSMIAQNRHMALQRERPDLSLEQNLSEVSNYVKSKFPERFGTQRPTASSVEPGGRVPVSSGSRKKGSSDLPADARSAGERYVKQGIFKDLNEYAQSYWSQD